MLSSSQLNISYAIVKWNILLIFTNFTNIINYLQSKILEQNSHCSHWDQIDGVEEVVSRHYGSKIVFHEVDECIHLFGTIA